MNNETTPKERMLKKVRQALLYKTPNKYPILDFETSVWKENNLLEAEEFAQQIEKKGGRLYIFNNGFEALDVLIKWSEDKDWKQIGFSNKKLTSWFAEVGISKSNIGNTDVNILKCECLISNSGTIVISNHTEQISIDYNKPMVFIGNMHELVHNRKEAHKFIKNKYGEKLPESLVYFSGNKAPKNIISNKESFIVMLINEAHI